nr:metalloregulator ArsR/SmtB family transcription factor [Agrobacterium sp. MA01]
MNLMVRDLMPAVACYPTDVEFEVAAEVFSALANPTRLAVFCRIIEREWSVNELADSLSISQSALSQHLRRLRDSKMVKTRRDRQSMYYSCSDKTVIHFLTYSGLLR